jgi:hypothetical protein
VAADLETLRAAFAAGSFDTDAVGVPASPTAVDGAASSSHRRRTSSAARGSLRAPMISGSSDIVHLGLGAFHRAHQLWYTQHSEADPSDPQWGFASFCGWVVRFSGCALTA